MKAFLAACVALTVIAVGAAVVLDRVNEAGRRGLCVASGVRI